MSVPLNQTGFVGCAEATLVNPNVVSWLIAVPPRNAADDNRSAVGPVPITVWPKNVAVYVPSPLGITVIWKGGGGIIVPAGVNVTARCSADRAVVGSLPIIGGPACVKTGAEEKALVESKGGEVVGLAVVIYQPTPTTMNFDPLPFYYLAKLEANYYKDAKSCDLCKRGVPVAKVGI